MKIAFTTLACPEWTWEKIVDEAAGLGYDGIEIRGLEGEMSLPKCRPFQPKNIEATIRQLKNKGLEICCLDTSCMFHDPDKFDAAVEEGKAAIDLAQQLGTPYVRVFGDKIPDPAGKQDTIDRVARGLQSLCRHASGKGVTVLLETHGDFSDSRDVLSVVYQVNDDAFGVLWDINNPYKYKDGETMKETYERLGNYIKHTHIKDTLGHGQAENIRLVGQGDVPIGECIAKLRENGYTGWLSFEWEKRWHPSIEEPEIALPQFIEYIKQFV
ncbi:sugar phosphate isomerase/epimerase [Paenibacillus filicis]|uniref:Sugar phosphate isomerase/epimerase n=1 Tax=Paenibacillus gyeongsangnamensis TaxID=3388067 RepID=A0ABT4QGR2_9BACL|nr:sugar phosphate isomerase/epimerase family protein [Paenibacillus filicis]MCZ8516078.1 sugar phosphate isomerase/epimerase [Paenibacillus filicis]